MSRAMGHTWLLPESLGDQQTLPQCPHVGGSWSDGLGRVTEATA